MTKITRTPTLAGGGITAQEKQRMDQHARSWISNAMRTDTVDRPKLTAAIEELYRVSGLKKPRVVIVPSPLVMAMAGGFSAAIWWLRKNEGFPVNARHATTNTTAKATANTTTNTTAKATAKATDNATDSATYNATAVNATYSATDNATANATARATRNATDKATDNATYSATARATYNAAARATDNATHNATTNATFNATENATTNTTDATANAYATAATRNATYSATANATDNAYDATFNATDNEEPFVQLARDILGEHAVFGLRCAQSWHSMYQGGNMWSAYDCYLTACRDILGLQLPEYEKYASWEQAALNGGFRIMHEEFCMVSDFPCRLKVDEQNRPHSADGPSHEWRDGWKLYYFHGVRLEGANINIIEAPETITVSQIDGERNAEIRRVMIERYGQARYLADSGAEVVHELSRDQLFKGLNTARLLYKAIPNDEPIVMIDLLNSTPEPDGTTKRYTLRVDPNAYNGEASRNCHAAVASTWRNDDGSLAFKRYQDYVPAFES